MNTDQYYSNPSGPHQQTTGYYLPNGMEPQFTIRNPNGFPQSPAMHQQYYHPQMQNGYNQPIFVPQNYIPAAPFVHGNGQRAQSQQYRILRPPNEASNPAQTGYSQQTGYPTYGTNTLQQQAIYSPQGQVYPYPPQQTYASPNHQQQIPATQIPNQSQYTVPNHQQQTQTQSPIDQQHVPTSQPRKKNPLNIVDPATQKKVDLPQPPTINPPSTTPDENREKNSVTDSTTNQKYVDEAYKSQKQGEYRKQFAELLRPQTDKDVNPLPVPAEPIEDAPIKITESISYSPSDSKTPTPSEPIHPGIPTESEDKGKLIPDDIKDSKDVQTKSDDFNVPSENSANMNNDKILSPEETSSVNSILQSQPQSTLPLSPTGSGKRMTPPQTPTPSDETESIEKTSSILKPFRYSMQELLNKRTDPSSQRRPSDLRPIEGVTISSASRSMSSKPTQNDSRYKEKISLPNPEFEHRCVERGDRAYVPVDKNRIDASEKLLREVKLVLNKLTPQTYEKLLKELDELELDRYERLDGMIDIIFSKAVQEITFCSLYAKLCKHFQMKQVTVPGENGEMITHKFRQILLIRCQKGFESDYRQEINYEQRKSEVDVIPDEKTRREQSENLEEDLGKAKRRKLGNIYFIGELFKLQMLTAPIMYDCVEYLLRDKADEENLECLCRLLSTIGIELEARANEKALTRGNLEKNYRDLESIITQKQASARARFMIQDLMDLRKANWVARRVELKPVTIDEIHEQERIRREQQERDQERDRQQRRDHHRGGNYNANHNPQQYTGRGSQGSGMKQQSNRTDDDRNDNRFNVNSVRQLQSNDKRNQGPLALNLAPQRAWSKGSGVEKKPEDDRSLAGRTGKPPSGPAQPLRPKTGTSPGTPGYAIQRQPSRELARENSHRDRENAMQSLRNTSSVSGVSTPNNASIANSREGSRNASRESSVSGRTSNVNTTKEANKTSTPPLANDSTIIINPDPSNKSFDEEKAQARVHSLIEEYAENYSENSDRPVNDAIEDLSDFCTSNIDQQAIVVRELFSNVLEAKPRARKAIGHLLNAGLQKKIISEEGFIAGLKLIVEATPDYAVDIPLIWQYIGEILGAFIGASSSNMSLVKPILQSVPEQKSNQIFQYIIRYATEFSSKSRIQRYWQSSGLSLNDLLKSDFNDSSLTNEYDWLSEPFQPEVTVSTKESNLPRADTQLVKLFKSINDQGTTVNDAEIITYIHEHMDPKEKFYIRNIVLSYLEACLVTRERQQKIQEDIVKKRMTILNAIIEHKPEAEIQAVYAIQNFVHKLEHPPKMARLLFDIFYDEECVSEDAFLEWLRQPDQSETEGHSVVEISTRDFFTWLQQAEVEGEEAES